MATLKGIGLKAVKTFTTGDGLGFTSNLYIDNKKVGIAEDKGQGGEVEFHILKPEHREEFSKRVKKYYEENPAEFDGEYDFINELFEAWETEKQFKASAKKGFPILIAMAFDKRTDDIGARFEGGYKSPIMVGVRDESIIQEQLDEHKPVEYKVFRQLSDFDM